MTWNKLEWLPEAERDYHPRSFPWAETTQPEGVPAHHRDFGWPTYRGWTVMPHATVCPCRARAWRFDSTCHSARRPSRCDTTRPQPTNGDFIFQFELIGTCDPHGPGYFWPNADDAVLLDLWHKVIKPLDLAFLIPFRALVPTPTRTRREATACRTRHSTRTRDGWDTSTFRRTSHGDPGAFPWARLAAVAAADAKKDDEVTPGDIAAIAAAVWNYKLGQAWDGQANEAADVLSSAQRYAIEAGFAGIRPKGNGNPGTATTSKELLDELAAVKAGLDDLRRVVATIPHGPTGG
jgi:hypothetical protein